MSYRDPTYVIFDGDKDQWAYQYMRGWQLNDRIDFDFRDAHDLDNMTSRAQGEGLGHLAVPASPPSQIPYVLPNDRLLSAEERT